MDIKKLHTVSNNDIKAEAKKQPTFTANQVEAGEQVYPDSAVLKAYANITPNVETVSREEALKFIQETGTKFEPRCEEFLKILADSDGYIKKETFDWVKNGYENTGNLFLVMRFLDGSKEDGKINRNMLELMEQSFPVIKAMGPNRASYCSDITRYFKDKEGKFNDRALKIITKFVKERPEALVRNPDYLAATFRTKDFSFDTAAIEYWEQNGEGRPFKELKEEIFAGKNSKGVFSAERLNVYKELKPTLELWQISLAQNIADSFTPEQTKEKQEFLELAKKMSTEKDLAGIFETITDIESTENIKTGLKYNQESVDFIRELQSSAYGYQRNIPDILKKINIPISEYTQEDKETVKRIFTMLREPNDIEPLLEAAVNKTGEAKGVFNFKTLDKYLDIYNSSMRDINEVKYISNILSLETDSRALDTIQKLYNLEWEVDGRYGQRTERLDKNELHFIFEMSTLSAKGDPPKRQFLPKILDNFDYIMQKRIPMSSAEAFANFMTIPVPPEILDKLEKVGIDEIGLKTGQLTHGKFMSATEEELLKFKEYMTEFLKDKNKNWIDIELNGNIKDIIEVKHTHDGIRSTTVLYDMVKQRPTTEMSVEDYSNWVYKEQKDYEKNIITKQNYRKEKEENSYRKYANLKAQTVEQYDKDWKLQYTETMEKSDVNGVFNVFRTYPDGRVEQEVKATKLPCGNDLVEKNFVSPDGTRTLVRYEDDIAGNRIMDYQIIDENGNELMKQSVTFEVVDENHFISSRNNRTFDIKFNDRTIEVTDLLKKEKVVIELENFTKATQAKMIPLLKQIPGEELFMMKKLDLGGLSVDNTVPNACYQYSWVEKKPGEIKISEKYLDPGVALHEWGHGKDHIEFMEILEEINKDTKLKEIYTKERELFRKVCPDAVLTHIAYFGSDFMGQGGLQEGLAETNALLSLVPKNDIQGVRSHYWQKYFPKTIAYLAKLLH